MHIVLICVDAMRADHIGCYAGADRATPTMDSLAASGVCFVNAIAQASWTRPSVTSMMTGLYPSQHFMTDDPQAAGGALPALGGSVPTLAELLSGAGFTTAAFVAGNAFLKPEFGIMRGFSHCDFLTTTDGSPVVERWAAWLDETGPEQSFSYLHLMETHNPLPQEIAATRPMVDKGVDLAAVDAGEDTLRRYYADSVTRADDRIADILAVLDARGLSESTWVITTADHGEELNEHGAMLSHGQSLYRQLVWVPLIMRLAGGPSRGRRVTEPVSHIDLMPTILDAAGVTAPPLPGRSLMPLLRGDRPENGAVAFSELLKRVRYLRSITTGRHHLIETFHVTNTPPATAGDLVPGVAVEVKGQPLGGRFVPTKISIDDKASDKVLGLVEAVDAAAGLVTLMGLTLEVSPDAEFVGLDKEPFDLAELQPGDRLGADLAPDPAPSGRRVANRLMRRKAGGESKLEGPIEAAGENGDGYSITVLGQVVPVDDRVRLVNRNAEATTLTRYDVVDLVREGRYVSRVEELYDLVDDPAESRNLAAEQPALAQDLRERLTGWADELPRRSDSTEVEIDNEVEIDDETIARLRALGYLA
jgi:arylsulfatase A-like enzyme